MEDRPSQSVKNTDSAEQKGYDAGKKVSGIKRHIAVDTQDGCPTFAIHVTTANVTDRAGALAMFDQRRDDLSLVQRTCWWTGVTLGSPLPLGLQSLLGASVEVVKRNEHAHLRSAAEAMGGGAVFRSGWKSAADSGQPGRTAKESSNQPCSPVVLAFAGD